MGNSTLGTVYSYPYVNLWGKFLAEPLPHGQYYKTLWLSRYQNNYICIQSLVVAVLLLVWFGYRLASRRVSGARAKYRHMEYLMPGRWMVRGQARSLGALSILATLSLWIAWSLLSLKVAYYEGLDREWSYLYDSVVVSNGSVAQISEIRDALYQSEDTGKHGSYRQLLEGIPLIKEETPMDYQNIAASDERTQVDNPLSHAHNAISMESVTLSRHGPSVITNRHMFDRWMPEIYYPDGKYWVQSIRYQFFQSLASSILTSSMFLGASALCPALHVMYPKHRVMGRSTAVWLAVYGLVRLLIFPSLELLQCDLGLMGLVQDGRAGTGEQDGDAWDYWVPYNDMAEEQTKLQMSRMEVLERMRHEDAELYRRVMDFREQVAGEHGTGADSVYRSPDVVLSPWVVGIVKHYILFLERIAVLVVLVLVLKRVARISRDEERGEEINNTPEAMIKEMQDPSRGGGDGGGVEVVSRCRGYRQLAQFVSVVAVNCVSLALIPLLHLAEPHSGLMLDHPLLQDTVGLVHWATEVLMIVHLSVLLFPADAALWAQLRGHGGVESLFQTRSGSGSRRTIESPPHSPASPKAPASPQRLKYHPPTDYPLPEWTSQEVGGLAPADQGVRQPLTLLKISMDETQDPMEPIYETGMAQ